MSDIINHYQCNREVFNALPRDLRLTKIIMENYDAFALGSQGPDFFYYQNPLQGSFPLNRIGSLIHKHCIDAFFYYGFRYALSTDTEQDILIAYLSGFSLHHTLDVNTHPYIFYHTGSGNVLQNRKYSYYHKTFETLLDVTFNQYEYQKLACYFNFQRIFTPQLETIRALENFYAFILKILYDLTLDFGQIHIALRNTARISSYYQDPRRHKRNAFNQVESLFSEEGLVSRVFYPMYANEFTVLNLGKESYHHPVTGEVFRNTYPDLFQNAVTEGIERLITLNSLLEKGVPAAADIHSIYKNITYDRCVPEGSTLKMQYFSPTVDSAPHRWWH